MVKHYFEEERKRILLREDETESELKILEETLEMLETAELVQEEKEELSRYIVGQQERNHSRLDLLAKRKAAVLRILEVCSITDIL